MADLELRAERRAVVGKKVRFLRRQGLLPGSLYGPGLASTPLQLSAREAEAVLRRTTSSTLLPLHVGDEAPRRVLVRQLQRHPVTDQALHVDFFALPMNETMRAEVPVHFVGEAPAVAQFNGTLLRGQETVEVECLPTDLPARLEADLSALADLSSVVHAGDLPLPPRVTLLTAPETPVATVVPPRIEAEVAAEAAAAEAPTPTAEAEAPAEPEASAEAPAAEETAS